MTQQTALDFQLIVAPPADWLNAFASQLRERGSSERTLQAYQQDLRSFAAWYAKENGAEFGLSDLTGYDLRAYREHCLDVRQLKPATWNRRRAALKTLCSWALEQGCLTLDPSADLAPAKSVEAPIRWLEKKDANKLMRQAERLINGAPTGHWRWQAIRDQAILSLMLYAGLREGEVVALDLSDLDLGERVGRVTVRRGKGDKFRQVPLAKEARRALRLWLDARGADPGALFPSKRAPRISTRAVITRVREIGRMAGVELTPHDLRHTCAKRMCDEGVPLTVVQKILGHARLETTARYVKPGWDDLAAAVERI